jgi:hypothetical protein
MDEERLKKLSTLQAEWYDSRSNDKDWRAPMQKYFESEKAKNSRKGR